MDRLLAAERLAGGIVRREAMEQKKGFVNMSSELLF